MHEASVLVKRRRRRRRQSLCNWRSVAHDHSRMKEEEERKECIDAQKDEPIFFDWFISS
jgi:hypothetical protein